MADAAAPSRAFVLHSRPWRETSLLVDWLTEDWGRITTCQRGIRRGSKGAAGRPSPFLPMSIGRAGRGGLPVAQPMEPLAWAGVSGCWLQGQALAVGFYFNELLLRALHPDEPLPALFQEYAAALSALCAAHAPLEVPLRRFERGLLAAMGLDFDWRHTADTGEPIDPERVYQVWPEQGIVAAISTVQTIPSPPVGQRIAGRVLRALAEHQPQQDAADRKAAQALLHRLLVPVVGTAPFHSRRLWRPAASTPA